MMCNFKYNFKVALKNGFESMQNSSRSKKLVAKRLGKAFRTENGAITPRGPEGRCPGWINPSPKDWRIVI